MGRYCFISNQRRHVHLLSLLLLLCSTQGRPLHKLGGVAKRQLDDQETVMAVSIIGSRPPRCEGMCFLCGHCEAVQVPVSPQGKGEAGHLVTDISSRVDESSTNYKPLNWKCKCGDRILNP